MVNSLNDLSCNKHGLVETPYKSTSSKAKGVLLVGNSVAMGEGLYAAKNKKTFASQLERNLRIQDKSLDLINAAYSGYNTWQEHVEIMRYLNAEPLHDDLPKPSLIISFGGIQDFWNFIRLLTNKKDIKINKYKYANGMMIAKENINYIEDITSSYNGNIRSGINALMASISKNSNIYYMMNIVRSNLDVNDTKLKDKSQIIIELSPKVSYASLEEIVSKRFNLSIAEYNDIRDYLINSVVRNINSNAKLIESGKYVYAYAPTYFTSLKPKVNRNIPINGIGHLINRTEAPLEIYEKEMQLIERDYREELIKNLRLNPDIQVLDYANAAESTAWFIDYSHLTEYGASRLSSALANDLIPFIK
ncbi:hypothetical protein EV05_1089 [Prochlorococcus sp. MIT 0601]|nr:hypothetical protein EV05_1089 [Prochlorococcus sp. MIT 0601]